MWYCFMRGLELAHGNKEPPSGGSPVKGSAESPPKTERLWQSMQHFSFTAQPVSPPSFVPTHTDCEIICATCAWGETCATRLQFIQSLCGSGSLRIQEHYLLLREHWYSFLNLQCLIFIRFQASDLFSKSALGVVSCIPKPVVPQSYYFQKASEKPY